MIAVTKTEIKTSIGRIAVFGNKTNLDKTPVIFLHGVYFDHHLWDYQISKISDRQVFAIDMPLHGESKTGIRKNWNMDDCADMLIEILEGLKLEKVIAIGHSWGSMTIIRAADRQPGRFAAIGLCNMPFKEATSSVKLNIRLQHTAIIFKSFYMKQAGKALMAKESLDNNPGLLQQLTTPMSRLTNNEIKYTDTAVRINAKSAEQLIERIKMPALALVGREDYVGVPPFSDTIIVKGGHVSPLEAPDEVANLVNKLIKIAG